MKRLIILLLLVYIATISNAQIIPALITSENETNLLVKKNCALLTKATIELKGYEWYEQYILKNIIDKNLKYVACYISFYSDGTYSVIFPKGSLLEIKCALPQVLSYIEKHKSIIYGNLSGYYEYNVPNEIEEKRQVIKNIINKSTAENKKNIILFLPNFYMGAIETIVPYKKLSYLKENKENAYANFRKWYLNELDSIIALPIKSTLDDDINILEFHKK